MLRILSKIFNYYLWIHIVYVLIMVTLLFAHSHHKFYLQCESLLVLFIENIFFFVISYIYISIRSIREYHTKKTWTIISIIIINLLSMVLFFRDPFYLLVPVCG